MVGNRIKLICAVTPRFFNRVERVIKEKGISKTELVIAALDKYISKYEEDFLKPLDVEKEVTL